MTQAYSEKKKKGPLSASITSQTKDFPIGGLQPIPRDPKDNGVSACWMTEPFVSSSNMAAIPLSFGSPGIGCKPPIISSDELGHI